MNQSDHLSITENVDLTLIENFSWYQRNEFNTNWTLYKTKIQFVVSKVSKNRRIFLRKRMIAKDMEEVMLDRGDGTSVCVQDGGARGLNCRENRQEVACKRKPRGVAASRGSPLRRMWSEEEEEEGRAWARRAFFNTATRKSGLSNFLGPVSWSSSWPRRRWSPGNATRSSVDYAHPTTPSRWTSSVKRARTDSSLTRYKLVCRLRFVIVRLAEISLHVNLFFLRVNFLKSFSKCSPFNEELAIQFTTFRLLMSEIYYINVFLIL